MSVSGGTSVGTTPTVGNGSTTGTVSGTTPLPSSNSEPQNSKQNNPSANSSATNVSTSNLSEQQLQRLREVERINSALAVNPFLILKVRSDATSMDIKAAYKNLSMMIHPDRCAVEFVERAKIAFAKLNTARDELLDEEKRTEFTELILAARSQVMEEWKSKRTEESRIGGLAASIPPSEPNPQRDITLDPAFDDAVLARLTEMLIEREWIKRKLISEHAKQTNELREEQERKRAEAEQQSRETKQWEQARDTRVNDWKSFMSNKRIKIIKPPAHKTEEDSRSAQLRKAVPNTNIPL